MLLWWFITHQQLVSAPYGVLEFATLESIITEHEDSGRNKFVGAWH